MNYRTSIWTINMSLTYVILIASLTMRIMPKDLTPIVCCHTRESRGLYRRITYLQLHPTVSAYLHVTQRHIKAG